MKKQLIQPKSLQDPRPGYSQAFLTEPRKVLFLAGQTAVDGSGNIVGKGDIEAQTRQVMENIKAVLDEAGASFDDIVKTTVYLTDLKHREGVGKVRRLYFQKDPPASTLLVIKSLAREEYLLEIEAIAVLD